MYTRNANNGKRTAARSAGDVSPKIPAQMTNHYPALTFTRCLGAMFVWFSLSLLTGLLGTLFGPGAAAAVFGLYLGFCGMTLHLILWAIRYKPHWSYAGLLFGAATMVPLYALNHNNSSDPIVLAILFGTFSLLSYIIYPIASYILDRPGAQTSGNKQILKSNDRQAE